MTGLFPGTMHPEQLGADLLYFIPGFFAIHPHAADLPAVISHQRRFCDGISPPVVPRPGRVLHVSVADRGRPKRRRQAVDAALAEAADHFSSPAFGIVFDEIACFGTSNRALVAVADTASQDAVHALRIAIADAMRHAGLFVSRARQAAHLTLGYGQGLPDYRRPVEPFGFGVAAVDLVVSEVGHSRHHRLEHWALDALP